MSLPELLLASQSPRRAALLSQIGVSYRQQAVEIDETPAAGELASDYVLRLAKEKAAAGWSLQHGEGPRRVSLGSDTSVVQAGRIMGKPRDREDGLAMLAALSAQTHQVMTAVALHYRQHVLSAVSVTDVRFRVLTSAEMADYWQSGEPADKAGGYGIQGLGATFVEHLSGSYSGVVGLPLMETHQLLIEMDKIIRHE